MEMDLLIIILIAISVVLVIEGIVAISLLSKLVKKSQNAPLPVAQPTTAAPQMSGSGRLNSDSATERGNTGRTGSGKDGLIICRNCYGVLPRNSKTCSYCQSSVQRR